MIKMERKFYYLDGLKKLIRNLFVLFVIIIFLLVIK